MPTGTVSENALGNIPTEKLILRLLQELATRVEKLETRDESVSNLTVDNSTQSDDSQSTKDSPSTELPSADRTDLNSRCTRCKEYGHKSDCKLVAYGYLFDGDKAINELMKISERYDAISESDPGLAGRLRALGIAGIPAGGRIPFPNFSHARSLTEREAEPGGVASNYRRTEDYFWLWITIPMVALLCTSSLSGMSRGHPCRQENSIHGQSPGQHNFSVLGRTSELRIESTVHSLEGN
jgi:hypothetical protein